MKKILIVCCAALFAICLLNVNLVTKGSVAKKSNLVSLHKALADAEDLNDDSGDDSGVTDNSSDTPTQTSDTPSSDTPLPPMVVPSGPVNPQVPIDVTPITPNPGPNPPIDLGDPAETLREYQRTHPS